MYMLLFLNIHNEIVNIVDPDQTIPYLGLHFCIYVILLKALGYRILVHLGIP